MINISHISKSYETNLALDDISLHVHRGELFGLIGPDGAGKTSLMRILMTLLLPDDGQAEMMSFDIIRQYRDIRRIAGYMPGRFSLYQDLTVEENLRFFATVFGTTIAQNYDLIKDIYHQIEPFKKRRAGKLSGGMKQKLALSCALIHKPQVLILDEPTTGVDAVSRKEFWDMLKSLKNDGMTILVSTPYMDEAELCDRIALLQNGKIMATNTPAFLKKDFNGTLWQYRAKDLYHDLKIIRDIPQIKAVHTFGQYLHITASLKTNMDEIKTILKNKNTLTDFNIKSIEPNIEDIFMQKMTHHD